MPDPKPKLTDAEKEFWQRNLMFWIENSERDFPTTVEPLPEVTADLLAIAKRPKL